MNQCFHFYLRSFFIGSFFLLDTTQCFHGLVSQFVMNDFLNASGQFFLKKLLNILVVLNEFYYHLKLLYLFLIHPVSTRILTPPEALIITKQDKTNDLGRAEES
jgi:hypothetical protein